MLTHIIDNMKRILFAIALIAMALQTEAKPQPVSREMYLDIMEKAVLAYTTEDIQRYSSTVDAKGVTEHGFGRLTSNIGILVSHGRLPELKEQFEHMMDLCVREMPKTSKAGNEFAIKEIVLCLQECERSGIFTREKIQAWKDGLSGARAEELYHPHKPGGKKADNWGVFGVASECARVMAGIGGDIEWAEVRIADQIRWFDENGMYMDPNQPITYDFVTRLQFMAALKMGYSGPSRAALEERLLKSAPYTLQMQSVSGEYPFGGRSNGFLFNESVYAAVCEYYASWFRQSGDEAMASRFKAAALRSVRSLDYWLEQKPVRHIKNRFPTETKYGCEGYAYFDKYMVTMGSFAFLAYLFADDSIVPASKPEKASTFVTSPAFHRVMMNSGGYTAEFELNADKEHDSNGLGRFQRAGAPPVIALSCPCPTSHPHYHTDIENPGPLSIAPCWDSYKVVSSAPGKLVLTDGESVWTSRLGKKGIRMTLTGKGSQMMTVPALIFDGETHPEVSSDEHSVTVRFKGWKAVYSSPDGSVTDTGKIHTNRSGHLRRYEIRGGNTLHLEIKIVKD